MMGCGEFEVKKLETGFLITVCPPETKEPMYTNSPMQMTPPKQGAVSTTGEVLEAMSEWLQTGDVNFKSNDEGKKQDPSQDARDLNRYGQEPPLIMGGGQMTKL
jgi:hypothetical protein